jgi:hypothetical protein
MECQVPIFSAVEGLQEVTAKVGLSEDDVIGLLFSGLEISDVVDYAEAMLTNRVH